MRRTVPLFKTVVPGLSHIHTTTTVSPFNTQNSTQNIHDNVDYYEDGSTFTPAEDPPSPPSSYDFLSTSTETQTFSSEDVFVDNSLVTATRINDVGGVRNELDAVFEDFQVGPSAHPGERALVETVKATASNTAILEHILNLPAFQNLVNNIPPYTPSLSERRAIQNEDEYFSEEEEEHLQRSRPGQRTVSSGTQTEDSYMESVERRINILSQQLNIPLLATTTTTTTTTNAPTHPSVAAPPPPSYPLPPSSPVQFSGPSRPDGGSAGVPGNTESSSVVNALKYVLPLTLLAVAAAVLRTKGALVLLKAGFKVICGRAFGTIFV